MLTGDEVLALLWACSVTAPTGVRNPALVVMPYRGGLRVGEALALFPKDVDRKRGTVRVLHGKGDKARTVGLDPQAPPSSNTGPTSAAAWGSAAGGGNSAPSSADPSTRRMSVNSFPVSLAGPASRSGFTPMGSGTPTRPSPVPRRAIRSTSSQDQLGHASLALTDRYLRHIAPSARIDALRRREWKSRRGLPATRHDLVYLGASIWISTQPSG